jgi:hypothetical protein
MFNRFAAIVPLVAFAAASAQVQSVTPYFAMVSGDDALLRCGNEDMLYSIAKLPKGQMLRVDGEGAGWARVGYPTGIAAFAPADALQIDAGGKGATVTKPVKLKAANLTTGLKGSWKDVLETAIPAGTKLTLIDSEATPDGRGGSAYKVAPPEAARAYIQITVLRKATSEEINAYMASQAAKPAEAKPADKPIAAKPGDKPATPTTNPPQPANTPGTQPGDKTVTLTDPVVNPNTAPVTPGQATPSEQAAAPVPNVEIKPPQPIPPSPYEKLEQAFEAVRKQPPETAEFGELRNEYQAALDKLDDSPASNAIRPRIVQRLEYLKLWTDIQDQKRKLSDSKATWNQDDQLLKQRLEEVDRVRQYTIVGRLSASTLYDGKRLPLMYRVQTVGGPAPRTLAYLKPDDKLNIQNKLGQVVGVLGESVVDSSLKIRIITPLRVDTLEPAAAAPLSPTTETPSEKPAADATPGGSQP